MKKILLIFLFALFSISSIEAQQRPSVTFHIENKTYSANSLVSKDGDIYKALSSTSTTPPSSDWEQVGSTNTASQSVVSYKGLAVEGVDLATWTLNKFAEDPTLDLLNFNTDTGELEYYDKGSSDWIGIDINPITPGENGLTSTLSDVRLGGSLIEDTFINSNSRQIRIGAELSDGEGGFFWGKGLEINGSNAILQNGINTGIYLDGASTVLQYNQRDITIDNNTIRIDVGVSDGRNIDQVADLYRFRKNNGSPEQWAIFDFQNSFAPGNEVTYLFPQSGGRLALDSDITARSAFNGLRLDGSQIRIGQNPLIENTYFDTATFDYHIGGWFDEEGSVQYGTGFTMLGDGVQYSWENSDDSFLIMQNNGLTVGRHKNGGGATINFTGVQANSTARVSASNEILFDLSYQQPTAGYKFQSNQNGAFGELDFRALDADRTISFQNKNYTVAGLDDIPQLIVGNTDAVDVSNGTAVIEGNTLQISAYEEQLVFNTTTFPNLVSLSLAQPLLDEIESKANDNEVALKLDPVNYNAYFNVFRDEANYGAPGFGAVDFSLSFAPSSTLGTTGTYSFGQGESVTASGYGAWSTGFEGISSGTYSWQHGYRNNVAGYTSATFGYENIVPGNYSFSSGVFNNITGNYAASFGAALINKTTSTTVIGQANTDYSITGSVFNNPDNPIFIVGNGDLAAGTPNNASARSDAFRINKNADVFIYEGDLTIQTSQASTNVLQRFTNNDEGNSFEHGMLVNGNYFIGPSASNARITLTQVGDLESVGDIKGNTISTQTFVFSSLPSGVVGMMATITDASSISYRGVAAGGGSDTALVFYDGTNWIYH